MTSTQHRDIESPATAPAPVQDGRRFVVTLGINSYAAWPQLHNAVNDATAVHERFVALGFEPVAPPLLDGDVTREALQWLATDGLARLARRDSLVVFFAGHGHTHTQEFDNGDRHQIGYLIPVDAKAPGDGSASWIRVDHWLRDIARLPARHILVILDSCHSGIALAFDRSRGATEESLAALVRHRSRRVVTSAREGELAADGGPLQGQRHSRFTGALLEVLASSGSAGDKVITGAALALQVQCRVIELAKSGSPQTPDFGRFLLDDGGDLLIPTGQADAAISPVRVARLLASPARSRLRRAVIIGDFLNARADTRHGGLPSLIAAAGFVGISGLISAWHLLVGLAGKNSGLWPWLVASGTLGLALHIVCSTHRSTLRYRYAQSLRAVSKVVAIIALAMLVWQLSTAVSMRVAEQVPVRGESFSGAMILGGTSATGALVSTIEIFDLDSGQWSNAPDDPIGRTCGARAVALPHGRVLVAGGSATCQDDGTATNRVRVFDLNRHVWDPPPTCQSPCIDLADRTFVPSIDHKGAWEPGMCEPKGPCMRYGRDRFTMLALPDDRPFAFGGCAGGCNGPNELGQTLAGAFELGRVAEIYDPADRLWSKTPRSLAPRRTDAVALVLGEYVLICGGTDGFTETLKTCERFDRNNDFNRAPAWREAGTTPSPVVALAPLPTGAIALGLLASDADRAWIWRDNTWQAGPKLVFSQLGGVLTQLRDGRVLLTGGQSGGRALSAIQVFDPQANEWRALPAMHVARFGHAAVRVARDRVLVAGGCSGGAQRDAEIFEVDTERWHDVPPLRSARCNPSITEFRWQTDEKQRSW